MSPKGLYNPMPPAMTTLFSDITERARAGFPVIAGTPGSVVLRDREHRPPYYAHKFYDGSGKQQEIYLGLADNEAVKSKVEILEENIKAITSVMAEIRLLSHAGYHFADKKTYATIATLHLHGLFTAGATLIGSHAYGILVNQLGQKSTAYKTEDIDVARREELALENPDNLSFLEMLKQTGIPFVEVPALDVRQPSTSFKERGASRLIVELLAPATGDTIGSREIPELGAHAATLPYLAYLLGDTHIYPLLSPLGFCPVRVPSPERFAIHKLIVSQLRVSRDAKVEKDLFQASALIAILQDTFPGALEEAVAAIPLSASTKLVNGLKRAQDTFLGAYPEVVEEIYQAIKERKDRD